jgi:hypothetical protein
MRDNIVSLPLHTVMSEAEMDHLFASASSYFAETT